MNLFLTFDKRAVQGKRRCYVCKDVPVPNSQCDVIEVTDVTPCKELLASMLHKYGDAKVYVTLGVPTDFNCLLLLMNLETGFTLGYDRRTFTVVDGRSYGMGMRICNPQEDWHYLSKLDGEIRTWIDVVNAVPRETGGRIGEWRGQRFRHRDFIWTVTGWQNLPDLIKTVRLAKLQWVDHTQSTGTFEIVNPGKWQISQLVQAGLIVWKDWTRVEMEAPNGE